MRVCCVCVWLWLMVVCLAEGRNRRHMFHRGTVQCHDCGQQVRDLKAHRAECAHSRKNKAAVAPAVPKKRERTSKGPGRVEDGTTAYLLVDVSSSMAGARLDEAKKALTQCFDAMRDEDRFAIVTFDTQAFFKLKPRTVEQLRRQNELPATLDRIFAKGMTALYDAIWMTAEQIHRKDVRNVITVLTDGEDNSSKHTLDEVVSMLKQHPSIVLDIVHIDGNGTTGSVAAFESLAASGRGEYVVVQTVEKIVEVTTTVFVKSYKQ